MAGSQLTLRAEVRLAITFRLASSTTRYVGGATTPSARYAIANQTGRGPCGGRGGQPPTNAHATMSEGIAASSSICVPSPRLARITRLIAPGRDCGRTAGSMRTAPSGSPGEQPRPVGSRSESEAQAGTTERGSPHSAYETVVPSESSTFSRTEKQVRDSVAAIPRIGGPTGEGKGRGSRATARRKRTPSLSVMGGGSCAPGTPDDVAIVSRVTTGGSSSPLHAATTDARRAAHASCAVAVARARTLVTA